LHICINAAHDVLRRKVRRGKWLEAGAVPEDIPDSSASALQNIAGAECDAQMLQAIGLLSKNQARAILMHTVEEIPYGDIAAAMDCREVTVRKHVARARARLRTLLAQQEEPSHA
jgi:RNA polymerase sigma-70 factor (ECF subfamily)